MGSLHGAASQGCAQRGEGGFHRRHVRRDGAADEALRVNAAGQQVGVGGGGGDAAATISHRARLRPGALRADMQTAGGVDPGDAAAAVADLDDVDDRGF